MSGYLMLPVKAVYIIAALHRKAHGGPAITGKQRTGSGDVIRELHAKGKRQERRSAEDRAEKS